MVKECKVLMNNAAVMVVDFDGVRVQMPSAGKNIKTVAVEFSNGSYKLAEDKKVEAPAVEAIAEAPKPIKKTRKKKAEFAESDEIAE